MFFRFVAEPKNLWLTSSGGQIYGIKPAWPEGEFYFYLVVLSGQQASSPTNTFHACGMIE